MTLPPRHASSLGYFQTSVVIKQQYNNTQTGAHERRSQNPMVCRKTLERISWRVRYFLLEGPVSFPGESGISSWRVRYLFLESPVLLDQSRRRASRSLSEVDLRVVLDGGRVGLQLLHLGQRLYRREVSSVRALLEFHHLQHMGGHHAPRVVPIQLRGREGLHELDHQPARYHPLCQEPLKGGGLVPGDLLRHKPRALLESLL